MLLNPSFLNGISLLLVSSNYPIVLMRLDGFRSILLAWASHKDRQRRITCNALVLAHDLPCVLYQPHTLGVKEHCGGREGIERLHCWWHSDYIVSRESSFGHLCPIAYSQKKYRAWPGIEPKVSGIVVIHAKDYITKDILIFWLHVQ